MKYQVDSTQNRINYHREMQKTLAQLEKGQPLLLHVCCAPCSTVAIERLAQHFALTLYFYNPNIQPEAEFEKRAAQLEKLTHRQEVGYPIKKLPTPWGTEDFEKAAEGLESEPEGGKRCAACFALRLNQTAEKAADLGVGWFATTLTLSPHKNAPLINRLGEEAAARHGVRYLATDFKKQDGFLQSNRLSDELDLYRQNYCGCLYSVR